MPSSPSCGHESKPNAPRSGRSVPWAVSCCRTSPHEPSPERTATSSTTSFSRLFSGSLFAGADIFSLHAKRFGRIKEKKLLTSREKPAPTRRGSDMAPALHEGYRQYFDTIAGQQERSEEPSV